MAQEWTPQTVKDWVDLVRDDFWLIQQKEWDGYRYGKSETEMWVEASKIVTEEWREIIRVLAQGGEYYSIQWTAHDGLRPSYRNEEGITIQC